MVVRNRVLSEAEFKILLKPISGFFIEGYLEISNVFSPSLEVTLANLEVEIFIDNYLSTSISLINLLKPLSKSSGNPKEFVFTIPLPESLFDSHTHQIILKFIQKGLVPPLLLAEFQLWVNFSDFLPTYQALPKLKVDPQKEGVIIPFEVQYSLRTVENHRILYQDLSFLQKILADLKEMVLEKKIRIISLDVFDTVLLRERKCEARRFYDSAYQFLESYSDLRDKINPLDIFFTRLMVHRETYRYLESRQDDTVEETFTNQVKIICSLLNIEERITNFIDNEIAYEIAHTELNPLFLKLLENFSELKFIFLSDTYLEANFIKTILKSKLKNLKIDLNFLEVFSSSDLSLSKRGGGIFHHIMENYHIKKPFQILHLGDNYYNDFVTPKSMGLSVYFLPLPDKEKWERFKDFKYLLEELKSEIPLEFLEDYLYFNP